MSNVLLIDADVFCYQFAYRNQTDVIWDEGDDPMAVVQPEVAVMEIDSFVDDLRETLKGDRVYFILSDRTENFRKQLDPTYKANRKSPKPELWETLRTYVETGDHGYPVRMFPRLEGDDVLGMMATHPTQGPKSIMVSIDKDMRTIPGRLYLYNKPSLKVIHTSREDAHHFHMLQTLMGDAVDGYKGIPGVGPKKAEKYLLDVAPADMWGAVVEAYIEHDMTEDDALLQARLAYILQYGDYNPARGGKIKLWNPNRTWT